MATVEGARRVREDFIKQQLHAVGQGFSRDLEHRLGALQELLDGQLKARVAALGESLAQKLAETVTAIDNAEGDVEANKKRMKMLQVELKASKAIDTFGTIFSVVGTILKVIPATSSVGTVVATVTTVVKGLNSVALSELKERVSALKSEIAADEALRAKLSHLAPLLEASQALLVGLGEAGADSISVRAWLAGPELQRFKASVTVLSPSGAEDAATGYYLWQMMADVASGLVDALDKAEWYVSQRVIVDLVTPIVPSETDPAELRDGMQAMRDIVSQNVVAADYTATMRSLQLFALPYCSLLRASATDRCMQGRSLEALVACAGGAYADLSARLQKSKTTIAGERRFRGRFERGPRRDRSFVTWSADEHGDLIDDVMAGEEVSLRADVRQGHADTYAVKFSEARLRLWHPDRTVDAQLQDALKDFKVSLVHMGTSHFTCGDDVVAISHRVLNITYSFEVGADGKPVEASDEYWQLAAGDMLVSPYALWTVRLLPLPGAKFDSLDFTGVSASLEGYGSYVDTPVPCDGCVWDYKVEAATAPTGLMARSLPQQRLYHDESDVMVPLYS